MFAKLLGASTVALAASLLTVAGVVSDGPSKAGGCPCPVCDCGADCGCALSGECDCGRGCCIDGCSSAQAAEFAVAAISAKSAPACCVAKEACCDADSACCEATATVAAGTCAGCAGPECQAVGCDADGCCEGACGIESCDCEPGCCDAGCCAK